MTPISARILSLDVFRGLIIVVMIVVNSQFVSGYSILLHADWSGFTLADFVFPSFLFIVGLTSVVSLNRHREIENKTIVYKDIIKRSVLLFLLGIFLNVYPLGIDFQTLRVYGILQRIALCYLVCSIIYLNSTFKAQILIFLGIILGYWVLMTQISVPGFGANQLTPEGSWVAYFDQILFSARHLYGKTYDPEGFLSTIPSIATTLFGVLIGQIIFTNKLTKEKKFIAMATVGLIVLLLGGLWSFSFPINKNLWTSSFVLWSSGWSLLVFSCCFLIIDILGYQKWSLPFKIFGMNALFAFIFHVLLLKTQMYYTVKLANGSTTNIKKLIADTLFSHYSPANSALLYALSFLFLNFLIVLFLYKRKIFIRI